MLIGKIKFLIKTLLIGLLLFILFVQKTFAIDVPNPIPAYTESSIFLNPVSYRDICFGSDWSPQ